MSFAVVWLNDETPKISFNPASKGGISVAKKATSSDMASLAEYEITLDTNNIQETGDISAPVWLEFDTSQARRSAVNVKARICVAPIDVPNEINLGFVRGEMMTAEFQVRSLEPNVELKTIRTNAGEIKSFHAKETAKNIFSITAEVSLSNEIRAISKAIDEEIVIECVSKSTPDKKYYATSRLLFFVEK